MTGVSLGKIFKTVHNGYAFGASGFSGGRGPLE
jgi:hypothetical protein